MEEFKRGDTVELINPYWRSKRFIISINVRDITSKAMYSNVETIERTEQITTLNLYNQIQINCNVSTHDSLKVLTCRMVLFEKQNRSLFYNENL